jgi:hypothetical protein
MQIRVLLWTCGLPVLEVVLRVLQVIRTSRITPPDRAFLEMALQNVTSAESVFAEMARIRTLAGIWKR